MNCLIFLFVIAHCTPISESIISKHKIRINGNGYKGIRIAISQNVIYDQNLIQKLKVLLTATSAQLYKSTKNHLYFKDITIVVPKTWPTLPEYTSVSGPQFDMAHVIVDEVNDIVGSRPYVVDMVGCGEGGQHIHVTPVTLLWQSQDLDKKLVHQWGHLRWGLFDEYPGTESATLTETKQYYVSAGTFRPNVCFKHIRGEFKQNCIKGEAVCALENGLPRPECKFCPDKLGNYTSSLMGYTDIISVDQFCDRASIDVAAAEHHNVLADTHQNRYCGMKSAWEVMREHADFKALIPGPVSQNTIPTFTIVQQKGQNVVFVLDVSGSMLTDWRLEKMIQATTNLLLNVMNNDTKVGIVQFNHSATILQPMTPMSSEGTRMELLKRLPQFAGGGTSIGAGLLAAIKCLNDSGENTEGSILILITDGKEQDEPFISNVLSKVLSSGVIINSLAFTENADIKIADLAFNTSGQTFFYSGTASSTTLVDAMAQCIGHFGDSNNALIFIKSESVIITKKMKYSGSFPIDSTIGKDTAIIISGVNLENITLSLTSPSYKSNSTKLCDGVTCSLKINGITEIGMHHFEIKSLSDAKKTIIYTIQSHQRSPNSKVITAKVWTSHNVLDVGSKNLPKIYVSVKQGYSPVLNAEVKAYLQLSNQSIQLSDSGSGSDTIEDDGIYSAYILPRYVKANGRNSIKVSVNDGKGKSSVIVLAARRRRNILNSEKLTTTSTNRFHRTVQADAFSVENHNSEEVAKDILPPSKITSLLVKSVYSGHFQIEFKSVGDDFDVGKVSRYDVRISRDFQTLISNPDSTRQIPMKFHQPQYPGLVETMNITLPDRSLTFYLGVRAVDDEGNKGDMSNIVSLSVILDTTLITQTKDSTMMTMVGVITSVTVALLMLTIAGLVFIFRRHKVQANQLPCTKNPHIDLNRHTPVLPYPYYKEYV